MILSRAERGVHVNILADTDQTLVLKEKPAQASDATQEAPSSPATADVAATKASRAYPAPAEVPTQQGPKGIAFDFNDGCRVVLPEADKPWHVRLSDLDTGNILFDTELKAGRVNSTKRYFVRFRIEVWVEGKEILVHDYSAKN